MTQAPDRSPNAAAGPSSKRDARPGGPVRALALAALAAAITAVIAGPLLAKTRYVDPYHEKVAAAGYVRKTAQVGGVTLSYAEGPDNGPPLVLLHAQLLDWFSYSRVLPELAKSYHVYDIDYPGHGETRTPANYPMTANQIGADLSAFIAQEIGGPVYVTGNSSGGLLAMWLAANRPEQIRKALLEDPPLFAAEYPRIKQTVAYRAFRTSASATKDHPEDFLLYWIKGNAGFFRKKVGPGTPFILSHAVKAARRAHPGQPVEIGLVKNDTVRMMLRGLDQYDPRFGAAFYDGTWNQGFDHAQALARVQCPVLLMHARYEIQADGVLDGALDQADADRAMALLKQGQYLKVDATHVVNLDKPDAFIGAVRDFLRD